MPFRLLFSLIICHFLPRRPLHASLVPCCTSSTFASGLARADESQILTSAGRTCIRKKPNRGSTGFGVFFLYGIVLFTYISLLDIAAVLPPCCSGFRQCGISIFSHKDLPPSPSTRSFIFPQRQIYICQLRHRTRGSCLLYQALSIRCLACLRLLLALPVRNPTTRTSQLLVRQDHSCTRIAGMES